MRKSAIVGFVFAGILVLVGAGLMCGSMVAYHYQPFYGGYRMMSSGFDALGGYLLSRMVFGAALFVGGIMVLCLSSFLAFHPVTKEEKKCEAKHEAKIVSEIEPDKKEEKKEEPKSPPAEEKKPAETK
jgi:ABC-type thiamin/hydroxymethylpyrimidine transport system permease subunit